MRWDYSHELLIYKQMGLYYLPEKLMSKNSWPNTQRHEFGEVASCHRENGDLCLRRWGLCDPGKQLGFIGSQYASQPNGDNIYPTYNGIIEMTPKMKFMKVLYRFSCMMQTEEILYLSQRQNTKVAPSCLRNLNPASDDLALIIECYSTCV